MAKKNGKKVVEPTVEVTVTDVTVNPEPNADGTISITPTQYNCPTGFGWCAVCKEHVPVGELLSTSIANVGMCKKACNTQHAIKLRTTVIKDVQKGGRAKKEKAPKKITKVSLILDYIADKNTVTMGEISKVSGHDMRTASSQMCILANPKRTKEPIPWSYQANVRLWIRNGYLLTLDDLARLLPTGNSAEKEAEDNAEKTVDGEPDGYANSSVHGKTANE